MPKSAKERPADLAPTDYMGKIRAIKAQHPDKLCLFRVGDFYELFDADALEVAKVLGLTVTKRQGAPMCGFPHHQLENYLHKLLKAGKRVAVCNQISDGYKDAPSTATIKLTSDAPPAAKKPVKAELAASPPQLPPTTNLAAKGIALALAELAETLGMTVRDTATLPDKLRAAGLPAAPDRHTILAAHCLHRDAVDGLLYRCGWLAKVRELQLRDVPEEPPELLPAEAREIERNIHDASAKAAQRAAAHANHLRPKEMRALAQKAAAAPKTDRRAASAVGEEF